MQGVHFPLLASFFSSVMVIEVNRKWAHTQIRYRERLAAALSTDIKVGKGAQVKICTKE
jgi:hypothetical protein